MFALLINEAALASLKLDNESIAKCRFKNENNNSFNSYLQLRPIHIFIINNFFNQVFRVSKMYY